MSKTIITIGRELGSGGRTIGKLVSEKLGINYYDYEIIDETAKESGFSIDFVKESEQRVTSSLLYNLALGTSYGISPYSRNEGVNLETQLYIAQQKVIKEMADRGPCVIVGRCADYILRDYKGLFRVFVYADVEFRKKRIVEHYNYNPETAAKEIKKADKRRAAHYLSFTEQHWGKRQNYDLMLNSGVLGFEKSADIIINSVK
ncbi:MAG: AAA family ATPase [Porcipelethomonas sp.]